jgi:hypothetical protein
LPKLTYGRSERDALGLLDAFAAERLSARYRPQDLQAIAEKVRGSRAA